ncbi:MAG: ABC transporter substrate-binding protein [Opitutaceae bacterium]
MKTKTLSRSAGRIPCPNAPAAGPVFARLLLPVALALAASLSAAPAGVRVVSQTVGTDELLLALAAPGQIAALSPLARDPEFCAAAEDARGYPTIAPNGDAESVLKFNPTLVLCADYSRAEMVAQLRRAGRRVILFDRYTTLADSYANLRRLGRELGREDRAERVIGECEGRVAALEARLRRVRPVRVIAPSTFGVIPGAQSTFQDLCDHAGAENLAWTLGHITGHGPQPSEEMLTWPVDFVVVAGADIGAALAPFRALPPYEFMPAVKSGRAVLLPPAQLSCVSHLRVDGYEILARALHPEAFR